VCFCHRDRDKPAAHRSGPIRDIVEWVDREYREWHLRPLVMDGEEILSRRDEPPLTTWHVLLDCGHVETVSTDAHWKPADGFGPRPMKKGTKRLPRAEIEREVRDLYADDEHHLAYLLRLIHEN
jgi:hypothetical protein